jgi:Arc/MetJ family transcription regulator
MSIEIDDELLERVMRRYRLPSKRAAVDLALRRLAGEPMSRDEALATEGSGWAGDLDGLASPTTSPVCDRVLADTSAWVEYLRATGSPVHLQPRHPSPTRTVATTEVVVMELLAGCSAASSCYCRGARGLRGRRPALPSLPARGRDRPQAHRLPHRRRRHPCRRRAAPP